MNSAQIELQRSFVVNQARVVVVVVDEVGAPKIMGVLNFPCGKPRFLFQFAGYVAWFSRRGDSCEIGNHKGNDMPPFGFMTTVGSC